jgi:hypothetical protein
MKYQASTVVVLSVHVLLQATHLLLWRPHPRLLLAWCLAAYHPT